jgi:hypothetical protein
VLPKKKFSVTLILIRWNFYYSSTLHTHTSLKTTEITFSRKLKVNSYVRPCHNSGCQLPAARVPAQVKSCGICGAKSGTGQVFSEYFGFPCQISFHRLLYIHHLSSVAGTLGQLVANVPSGLSLTPPSLTHGAEPFLKSRQLCSYSRTFQHFMKPEGSLPCSQESSTGPYPEPDQSNPYHPILCKIPP